MYRVLLISKRIVLFFQQDSAALLGSPSLGCTYVISCSFGILRVCLVIVKLNNNVLTLFWVTLTEGCQYFILSSKRMEGNVYLMVEWRWNTVEGANTLIMSKQIQRVKCYTLIFGENTGEKLFINGYDPVPILLILS